MTTFDVYIFNTDGTTTIERNVVKPNSEYLQKSVEGPIEFIYDHNFEMEEDIEVIVNENKMQDSFEKYNEIASNCLGNEFLGPVIVLDCRENRKEKLLFPKSLQLKEI